MSHKNNDYWLGRIAVEAAVALTALESGDEELARIGLKETVEEFLEDSSDTGLIEYVREIRQERQALTPVSIAYRDSSGSSSINSTITGQEIIDRL